MVVIRDFDEGDAVQAGILIADTYRKYNLSHISEDELPPYLGGFVHARSDDAEHRASILRLLKAPMVFVAEERGNVVGILRGRKGRLSSLFVSEAFHRKGIGRQLCECFEAECRNLGATQITLAASLYAVPFYQRLGYKKSTGIRRANSFDGPDFRYQPMKKVLKPF